MALLPQVTLPLSPCKFSNGYVDMDLVKRAYEVFTPPRSTKKERGGWTGGSERTPEGFLPPLMDGMDDEEEVGVEEVGMYPQQVVYYMQQQQFMETQRQLFGGGCAGELPRESENCFDATVALQYASPRGSNLRVSWRNKLWSNTPLLQSRYGATLHRYFRENYADRSPTSEPLLHNNYPSGSRVYFQGLISGSHCVCHHLVQVFEGFAVGEDGRPDPLGLQAIWIAPSQASGRIYGYAKFTSAGMASRAVMGLRGRGGDVVEGVMVSEEELDVLVHTCRVLNPPVNLNMFNEMMPHYCGWSSKGLALLRVLHALECRLHHPQPVYITAPPPAHLIAASLRSIKASAAASFGPGIITPVVIDTAVYGKTCYNQSSPVSRDPICFEEISLANEQRPGHRGKNNAAGGQ
eukprot:TRINITY_DN875_c3_g1_i2.p1 TRINITY_DN875_c3_g1~~TRINITY_DN875_c3_g1_i2.p1  ORF type:complete len:407 (+),score=98.11 TRINITY_DN875_c3_g1_i2:58-1278(+)